MAKESAFVGLAESVAKAVLPSPCQVVRGAVLLYEIEVDNFLKIKINPREPKRGRSAFQTDLCVFEKKSDEVLLPRVVLEFKTSISTHDVLTYSAKASRHKHVYPYLRYGIVASQESSVPGRVFTHNESLDFCAALAGLSEAELRDFFERLLQDEVQSSRQLEKIAFGTVRTRLFRTDVRLSNTTPPG